VIIEEVPELRIVSDELWNAVRARQTSIRDSEGDRPPLGGPVGMLV
jgi:hypothetical protein